MDTPDPGVVTDSQNPLSNVTPKSAGFGSPIATQDSWTAPPRRRQAKQKAKASFLHDIDDDDENDQDQQNGNAVVAKSRARVDHDRNLDFVSYDFDSGLKGQTDEDWGVYNQSPTPHTSQAARLPPQSAQPVSRTNLTESSDEFSVFEVLKKKPDTTATSKHPSKIPSHHEPPSQKQQLGLVARDRLAIEDEEGSLVKDHAHRPKSSARKSLVDSKVKLAALEVEGETQAQKPEIEEPREFDYSIPSSKNSSPASAPVKKRAQPKKQAAKKPPTKTKTMARGAKAAAGGRARNAKPAPDPPAQQCPEAQPDEEHNEDISLAEEPSIVTQPPQEASPPSRMSRGRLEPGKSVTEIQNEDVVYVSSDPLSSFPEADNTDDEDFECSRKMTPGNARRRTRAVAAESAAAKEVKRQSQTDAIANVRRHGAGDKRADLEATEKPLRQSKQPSKKTAIEKAQTVASHIEPKSKSTKEMKLSAEKSKKKGLASERIAASPRASKDKSEVKQETVISSNADRVAKGEAKKPWQSSEPVKETKASYRKPNVIAFGTEGPKNNGRSHKATAIIDSQSRVQEPSSSNGDHTAAAKSQPPKVAQKAARIQLNTAVQDGDSPRNDFAGHDEGGISRAARTNQSTCATVVPDKHPMPAADTKETVPNVDEEMTTLVYEAKPDDTFNEFATDDAEADTAVELAANMLADARDHQDRDMENDFEDNGDGGLFIPRAQADMKHLGRRGQRTVLGEMNTNYRAGPKDIPAVIPRPKKRKLLDTMTVEDRSPNQQGLPLNLDSLLGDFSTLRRNLAALNLPFGDPGRPVKKPRYNSAQAAQVNDDARSGSYLVGEPDGLSRGAGVDTDDDVFGPGKKSKPSGSSAFVQRLISNEPADPGFDQAVLGAPDSRDAHVAALQLPIAINHPHPAQSVASGNALRPQRRQEPDDVGKRMLAALGPERANVSNPWSPSDDTSKSLLVSDTTKTSLSDPFDQRRASDVDERARAWKKATEPYADSLGETMHRIVNVS